MPHNIVEEDVDSVLKLVDLSWFKDKKVLITGASGMIGYYLLECLTAAIHKGFGPSEIWVVSKTGVFPDEISKDMANNVVVIRINADDNQALCKELKIDALPVLQLYKNKIMTWTNIGFIDKSEVVKQLH